MNLRLSSKLTGVLTVSLCWDNGKVTISSDDEGLKDEIQEIVTRGLGEWVDDRDECHFRLTLASDVQFLGRLADNLTRQFPIEPEITRETVIDRILTGQELDAAVAFEAESALWSTLGGTTPEHEWLGVSESELDQIRSEPSKLAVVLFCHKRKRTPEQLDDECGAGMLRFAARNCTPDVASRVRASAGRQRG